MGDAMRSEEDQLASAQLDAFHETFNFCIGCRQYTCINCWNDADGRCRTCAPIAGTDDLTERLLAVQPGAVTAASAGVADAEPSLAGDEISRRLGLEGWPSGEVAATPAAGNGNAPHEWPESDPLAAAAAAALVAPDEPAIEVPAEPEPMVAEAGPEPEPELTLEPVVAEEALPWVEPEPEAWPAPEEASVAAEEPELVGAEPEPWPAAAEIEPEAEPVAATIDEPEPAAPYLRVVAWEADSAFEVEHAIEPEPVPAADLEPEPLVAEAGPEPESAVAEVTPEPDVAPELAAPVEQAAQPMPQVSPVSETVVRFPDRPATPDAEQPAVAAEADSPELAARRAQLDLLGLGDPGEGSVGPDRPAVLPYRSRGAALTPVELAMRAGGTGFWEASAREVAGAAVAQVGVQNCGECGLSLSATARFCRRCGTRQARSA